MTRLTTLLSSVCLILSTALPVAAATITVGDFTYSTSGSNAKVSKGPTTGDVVIPESVNDGTTTYTVTEVDRNAFKNANITSVSFPGTVTKIGNNAFEGCKALTKVEFAEGLKNLGSYAFKNCSALTNFVFPQTLTNLGSYSFDGCTSITSVVFPNAMSMAIGSPFQNCTSLRSITLGAKMNSFSSASTCKGAPLEEILVDEANTRLKSVDGVLYYNKNNKMTKIEAYPEYRKAETYTLPEGITAMSTNFDGIQYLKHFIGNDDLTSLSSSSFTNCPALESVTFGKGLQSFGTRCFTKSPKINNVTISADNPYLKCVDNVILSADETVLYARFTFATGTEYNAPATLTEIANYAFAENATLTTVTLPESVKTIGTNVFNKCVALTSVNIPASLTEIPTGMFSGCKKLESVVLPEGITAIQDNAFHSCYGLTSINIPAKVTTIGENAFYASSLKSIVIPDAVGTIGASAFYSCEDLTDVTIGSSVTEIGEYAFYTYSFEPDMIVYCKPLTPPALGSQPFDEGITIFVEKEAYETYIANESYQPYSIKIRADLSAIDVTLDEAGTLCNKVNEEQLNGVTTLTVNGTINGTDFEYINRMPLVKEINLAKATIVPGGTEIITTDNELPRFAVKNLTKLESITLPENLTSLGDSCLVAPGEYTGDLLLQNVTIPPTVTSIGAGAFANRAGLKEANMPEGLKYLGKEAYYGCEGLTSINIPAAIDTIRESSFMGCTGLTEINFNEIIKVIEGYAFDRCKSLETVVLPNSIDSIGNSVFADCPKLKNVTLSDNITYLGRYAFAWCTELEEIELPDNLDKIGSSCFSGCSKLKSIKIPESVTVVDASAFSLCPLIERIDIPRYVKTVGSNAFFHNTAIRIATIAYDYALPGEDDLTPYDPERRPNKTVVKSGAFDGCSSLEEIYIGSTISFLEEGCFGATPALTKVVVAATTPPDMYAGEPAFDCYDATLYVPLNSITLYRNNIHWRKFTKILPLELGTSAIDDITADNTTDAVTVSNGTLSFSDPDASVTVSNIAGQTLYSGKAASVNVTPGLYIVTIDATPHKIVVR